MRRSLRPNQYLTMIETGLSPAEGSFIGLDDGNGIIACDRGSAPADNRRSPLVGIDAQREARLTAPSSRWTFMTLVSAPCW